MGAGEQRVLRLLEVIEKVENYSLVIIDEIDLTLHNAALMRLIDYLVEEGRNRHIQFIFSSHCEALTKRKDINVRHLLQTPEKTLCFDESNPECLESITGVVSRPIEVYVEDILAKNIVAQIAKELGISKRVVIKLYGSCTNAFVASCGMRMLEQSLEHKLFVLDGDLYRTEIERKNLLKNFILAQNLIKSKNAMRCYSIYHNLICLMVNSQKSLSIRYCVKMLKIRMQRLPH